MNLDLLKIQYEIFDLEPEAIAVSNGVPTSHIVALIEDQKWVKNPLIKKAIHIEDSKDLVDVSEEYTSDLKERLNVTNLLKQQVMGPSYVKLETLLVQAAISIVQKLDYEHNDAAKNLKTLTGVLQDLLTNNADLTTVKEAAGTTDGKVTVQIMNRVERIPA